MSPVEDLMDIDRHLYNQLMDLLNQSGAECEPLPNDYHYDLVTCHLFSPTVMFFLGLELPFSVSLSSTWEREEGGGSCVVDIPLIQGEGERLVTDTSKVGLWI